MGTHYRGTPEEIRALDAYIKLMRASESIAARLERKLKARGLTISQFGVLEALHHLGPMCQRELGTKLLKSDGNVTTVVENLERRELICRRRSEEDRRFITVALTARGAKLISDLFPDHVTWIVDQFKRLEGSEQEELGRLCKLLGISADARRPRSSRAQKVGRT